MRAVVSLVLALTVFAAIPQAASADPLVSLFFSANDGGTFIPCPVCGNKALGGLPRRATLFERIRANAEASRWSVFVAGPYEFLAADGQEEPENQAWPALVKAFDRLGYQAGALGSREAKMLADRGLAPPTGWKTLSNKVQSQVIDVPNGKIGLIFFPELKDPKADPSVSAIEAVEREAARIRPTVNLVVGVSGWGVRGEEIYLAKAKPVLHVLLGAGDGVGFSARSEADGKTLWMRSYTKGRAIYELDVRTWPTGEDFAWTPGVQFATQAIPLDVHFPDAPWAVDLFKGVPPPSDTSKQ